jgi:hypothetical protein
MEPGPAAEAGASEPTVPESAASAKAAVHPSTLRKGAHR